LFHINIKNNNMKRKKLFTTIVLSLVVLIGACSKDEFQDYVGVCPIVIATSPTIGETNVALGTPISFTFNEEMNPATINQSSFTAVYGSTSLAGTFTYSGNTATFTPSSNLLVNTTYVCKITTAVKDLRGNALQEDYIWTFSTGLNLQPTIISTDPISNETGVALNKIITATFNMPMDVATINASTFTLKQGLVPLSGAVTLTGDTASFTPDVALVSNTIYTALITTGAKNLAGVSIAANYEWNFTTGNTTAPIVTITDPFHNENGVALNKVISATFSMPMDIATLTAATFTLKIGTLPVSGIVTYSGSTAYFTPTVNLASNTNYIATITTGAKNVAGVSLASNYVWNFSTYLLPNLGTAAQFGAFGGNAGITNQGINTVINNGSIGTTAASSLITGFHDSNAIYTETPLNVGNVTGSIYTAPPVPGTATSFAIATQGLLDANAAYLSISPTSMPGGIDPGAGELGGLTLPPGIYKSASGTFNITNGNLVLDAQGNPNAIWIFQAATALTVGSAGPTGAKSVVLINGALAKNVFWYVGSAATINGAGGGVMSGTIIATSGVTFSTAGNTVQTVLNGRAISLVASVTMVNTTINIPN
jgi:hypothetical protein